MYTKLLSYSSDPEAFFFAGKKGEKILSYDSLDTDRSLSLSFCIASATVPFLPFFGGSK